MSCGGHSDHGIWGTLRLSAEYAEFREKQLAAAKQRQPGDAAANALDLKRKPAGLPPPAMKVGATTKGEGPQRKRSKWDAQ